MVTLSVEAEEGTPEGFQLPEVFQEPPFGPTQVLFAAGEKDGESRTAAVAATSSGTPDRRVRGTCANICGPPCLEKTESNRAGDYRNIAYAAIGKIPHVEMSVGTAVNAGGVGRRGRGARSRKLRGGR